MVYPILVVEDDPKIAHIVKVYLEGAGFRVIHVDRGRAGPRRGAERETAPCHP